jgi:hypothetical protein
MKLNNYETNLHTSCSTTTYNNKLFSNLIEIIHSTVCKINAISNKLFLELSGLLFRQCIRKLSFWLWLRPDFRGCRSRLSHLCTLRLRRELSRKLVEGWFLCRQLWFSNKKKDRMNLTKYL